ncbi:hypothetical protein M569_12902 [Genlisea aurea]|uniref:MAT1 centre domain-containing protein n=1 Tax=Genlisea aurea TaxID=192259 RepID=S8DGJ6_9LAMI|nr:hypothetical protein M569_12902 [Genlisea aurea]
MVVASGTNSFAKEMAIRKRIASIYNKTEEDFCSVREYNDYLEEVEDMIVNLAEGINVANIEARISEYQKENAEQIVNSQARKAEEYAAALAAASQGQQSSSVEQVTRGTGTSNGGGQYAPSAGMMGGVGVAQPRPQPIPVGPGDMMEMEYEDEETMRARAERSARAGGWSLELSRKRAIEEAFSTIAI